MQDGSPRSGSRHGGSPPPSQQRSSGGGSRGPSRLQASAASSASSSPAPGTVPAQGRQQRSMPKKPPEPLRRAVADSLSATPYHYSSEALRTFQDFLASPATIHFAYTVLLEHALAERDRSPPVVLKCVSLLKRYLFRYVPPVATLQQIDSFCAALIGECNLARESVTSSLPTSVFGSDALIKSLNYVRAVVARRLPAFSLQQSASSYAVTADVAPSRLRGRVNSLQPVYSDENRSTGPAVLAILGLESVDAGNTEFIAVDVLKRRWQEKQTWVPAPVMTDSGGIARPQVESLDILDQGMASLVVHDVGKAGKRKLGASAPSQLLRIARTVVADAGAVKSHLRAVAATKRLEPVAHSYATVKKRPRPLFQYRYYSKQQPLRLSDGDIEEVITAVCSDGIVQGPLPSLPSVPETANVAASVLIKLVFDMYLADARAAAPLTLLILQGMLTSAPAAARVRAFDLVLNLGVHAHLLEPTHSEDQEGADELGPFAPGVTEKGRSLSGTPPAVIEFESWLLSILSEMMLYLVQLEERDEAVWAAAMSTMLYLICDRGRIRRKRLEIVDVRVLKTLLDVSRENAWAEAIHSRIIRMVSNLVFEDSSMTDGSALDMERLEMLGGIEVFCKEYALASNPETKCNLFAVILEYVKLELRDKERPFRQDAFQAVATSLLLAGAPESLGVAFCHKFTAVGARLAKSITKALDRDVSSGRLDVWLLEEVTRCIDLLVDKYAGFGEEFSDAVAATLGKDGNAAHLQGKAWATLRALLHSKRADYRQIGYSWLLQILNSEVACVYSKEETLHQYSLLKVLEQVKIEFPQEVSAGELFLELLKSKRSYVRRGFLIVLERLLVQCHRAGYAEGVAKDRISEQELASSLVQLMCGALLQLISANDTHRVNVLQMCSLMLSQICVLCSPESKRDVDPTTLSSMSALLLRDEAAASKHLVSNMPTALFYWPLMQLAGSTMDDMTLGIAVGSKGGGNVPGGASDVRCALLLLLTGKCSLQRAALDEFGGEEFFKSLLDDSDSRVAYYTASFLIKRMMVEEPDVYQRVLHNLVFKAQQSNNEKLLENPYLQMRGILQEAQEAFSMH